jgi:hypothetical protein
MAEKPDVCDLYLFFPLPGLGAEWPIKTILRHACTARGAFPEPVFGSDYPAPFPASFGERRRMRSAKSLWFGDTAPNEIKLSKAIKEQAAIA